MKRYAVMTATIIILALLLACSGEGTTTSTPPPQTTTGANAMPAAPTQTVQSPSGKYLTANPVETSPPIYGGTLGMGYWIPRTFDAHQKVSYGPTATLPVFNQMVMFDINYKETVPETIVGDLAESWETSSDGDEITFHLRKGVKWQDGVVFTSDDVIYSLDKMNDVNFSAIKDWFPAYESTEKIDEYTVKVHLKYPSAGFMMALAQGESQIQSLHLANVDPQSKEFMVGTGPYVLTEYIPQVSLTYRRNPAYFKKDQYGNQLPYLDGFTIYHSALAINRDSLIARRLDLAGTMTGVGTLDAYNFLKDGAPDLLWQRRDRYNGSIIFLNLNKKPMDDIRVRRAIGLVLNEEELIIGYAQDVMFGVPGSGILHPDFGLPKEEVTRLMGWDKPYEERVTEAKRLLTEAGYPDGFKLTMMSAEKTTGNGAATLVYADALHKTLNIDVEINSGLAETEIYKRLENGDYYSYTYSLAITDPIQLSVFFGTGGYANYAKYSNTGLDGKLADLDRILDPEKRREAIWDIERILLTDLPALPTGCFIPNFMPYYPWVKNLRWNNISYSNISRLEDVWVDESLKVVK